MDTKYYINDGELPIREKEAKALGAVHTPNRMVTQTMERIDQAFDNANAILKGSGWFEPTDKHSINAPKTQRLAVDEELSRSDWKSVLESAKQKLLDAKEAEAAKRANNKSNKWPPENHDADQVKLVNKNYFLSQKFKADHEHT